MCFTKVEMLLQPRGCGGITFKKPGLCPKILRATTASLWVKVDPTVAKFWESWLEALAPFVKKRPELVNVI
jgi:hypothetical protein